MSELTHIDDEGEARMVDVSAKPEQEREAVARGEIRLAKATLDTIESGQAAKGNVLATARLAGIMAAKKTADLIPLCHPLPLTRARVAIEPDETAQAFLVRAEVATDGKTGVEMEALTAASVAALTLYDMAKALDKAIRITDVQLEEKRGGKSGDYVRGTTG